MSPFQLIQKLLCSAESTYMAYYRGASLFTCRASQQMQRSYFRVDGAEVQDRCATGVVLPRQSDRVVHSDNRYLPWIYPLYCLIDDIHCMTNHGQRFGVIRDKGKES
eukprot:superscaffoldBa00004271_g18569